MASPSRDLGAALLGEDPCPTHHQHQGGPCAGAGHRPGTIFHGIPPVRPEFDFSADGVRRSLDDSLERLSMDRVDLALVHDPDDHEDEARATAFRRLQRLRDEGLIGGIGCGHEPGGDAEPVRRGRRRPRPRRDPAGRTLEPARPQRRGVARPLRRARRVRDSSAACSTADCSPGPSRERRSTMRPHPPRWWREHRRWPARATDTACRSPLQHCSSRGDTRPSPR